MFTRILPVYICLIVSRVFYCNNDILIYTYILYLYTKLYYMPGTRKMWAQKVTKAGFILGGAGYIISYKAIQRLISHTIYSHSNTYTNINGSSKFIDDEYRTQNQISTLALLPEALKGARKNCPNCIKGHNSDSYGILNHNIRIIDLCKNMLAGPSVCAHSDHTVSRCLFHAIYADTYPISCTGTYLKPSDTSPNTTPDVTPAPYRAPPIRVSYSQQQQQQQQVVRIGMCQREKVTCDPRTHLTCHRHVPDASDLRVPKRIVHFA